VCVELIKNPFFRRQAPWIKAAVDFYRSSQRIRSTGKIQLFSNPCSPESIGYSPLKSKKGIVICNPAH